MKYSFILWSSAFLVRSACEAPSSSAYEPLRTSSRKTQDRDTGSASIYSMEGSSAANPPIKAGETSSAYRERMNRQQRDSLPDAQGLYQNTASDAFARTTENGVIQQNGGITREISISNQPVYLGKSIIHLTQRHFTALPCPLRNDRRP